MMMSCMIPVEDDDPSLTSYHMESDDEDTAGDEDWQKSGSDPHLNRLPQTKVQVTCYVPLYTSSV